LQTPATTSTLGVSAHSPGDVHPPPQTLSSNNLIDPKHFPVDFVKPPYSEDVGKAVGDATIESFSVRTDGTSHFLVDGQKYFAREVALVFLRRFAARNDITSSQPPNHSLRRGTQQLIVDEIMFKYARRRNGREDPWRRQTNRFKKVSGGESSQSLSR
jgi:hypothetical protein